MNKKQNKVSILVPIYGVEKYIERCAESLLNQTYPNIEYIFVNDCTPDRSIEVLKQVIERYPVRKDDVHIINHAYNRGLAAARNTAIRIASGEFVMHVDSDDYIEIETVDLCMKKQQEKDADIVSFGCFREYASKTVVQNPPNYLSSKDMCLTLIKKRRNGIVVNVGVWGRLFRRTLYTENNIWIEEGINMAEDYQVVSRLAYYAKNIDSIDKPLLHYNLQNIDSYVSSISIDKIRQSEKSFQIVYDFFKDKGDEFIDALYQCLVFLIIRKIVDGTRSKLGKDFYCEQKKICKKIPCYYFSLLSFPYKIMLLLPSYNLTRLYLKLIYFVKH